MMVEMTAEEEMSELRKFIAVRGFTPELRRLADGRIAVRAIGLRDPEINYQVIDEAGDELRAWRRLERIVKNVPPIPWDGTYDNDTSHLLTQNAHRLNRFLRDHPQNDEVISSDELMSSLSFGREEFETAARELEKQYRAELRLAADGSTRIVAVKYID